MPIKTFKPPPFPPDSLDKKSLQTLLAHAHKALANFNKVLLQDTRPTTLFSSLTFIETFHSLKPHNLCATLDEILITSLSKDSKTAVQNYRKALLTACQFKQNTVLSKKQICILSKLLKNPSYHKTLPGYREHQNWIGPKGCTIEEAYFLPPLSSTIPKLMRSLLKYNAHSKDDPLIHIGIFFAQFLIIHPFMDGNGRIARLLLPSLLFQKKALIAPLLFLSIHFNKHRLQYFELLFALTQEQKWEKWMAFFLKGIIVCCKKHTRLANAIMDLKEAFPKAPKSVINYLFQNPFFYRSKFLKRGSASLFSALKSKGWIQKKDKDLYCFLPLLKILQTH